MASKPQFPKGRPLFIWVLLMGVALYMMAGNRKQPQAEQVSPKEFVRKVESKEITKVWIDSTTRQMRGHGAKEHPSWKTEFLGDGYQVQKDLEAKGADVEPKASSASVWLGVLSLVVPLLLMWFLFSLFMRRQQGGLGKALGVGKSKMTRYDPDERRTLFKDVIMPKGVLDEVSDIVRFLKDPKRFRGYGMRIPKGVLLIGGPGTGKTLLARAIAGEAGVPFFSTSGSEFVEMFVGLGATRVRDMMDTARKNAPSIVFIDELDAVGRQRGAGLGNGHDEREQTLNQILVELDGFTGREGVIIIAATNRPDVLDPALLRPGRFDRHVVVPKPLRRERDALLRLYGKGKPIGQDIDYASIASLVGEMTGADIENFWNEAASEAEREDSPTIEMRHLDRAYDKVMMGPIEAREMTDAEIRQTCDHEAGHAVLLIQTQASTGRRLYKMTRQPRGKALGMCQTVMDKDPTGAWEAQLHDTLLAAYGGRAAELILHGGRSTGPSNDILQATELADRMIRTFGMSETLGPVSYDSGGGGMTFLGRELAERRPYSEETARLIDEEKRRLLKEAESKAVDCLKGQLDKVTALSNALYENEKGTLTRDEIDTVLAPFHRSEG